MKVHQSAGAVKHKFKFEDGQADETEEVNNDRVTHDELFSDTYPASKIADCRDAVGYARKGDEVVQVNEGPFENVVSGSDVVFNHRVVETGCGVKKDVTVGQDDHEGRPKRDVSLIQAAGVRDRIGE